MAYDYSDLVEQTQRWSEQAAANGWIGRESADELCKFDTRTPKSLFDRHSSRPLIVAFMGGTGVGKSSLLNRLAGKPVAKAGIERPTSREVTLFHHRDIVIQHLPEKLPVEKIKIALHDDDDKKNIVWIDMPDLDSTEQSNKALVFEWLPHIDVLIYVVSPERYRDEKAWRLLLAEGNRHAWLFVLNQWDRGQAAQVEDFKHQLGKAGFDEPVIFKTVCGETAYPDEFSTLETTLLSLANQHIVAELEQRGTQLRLDELRDKLTSVQQSLGSPDGFRTAEEMWRRQWQTAVEQLEQGITWPKLKIAGFFANHAADLIANPITNGQTREVFSSLWDDWAQTRFADTLDEFVAGVNELGLPVSPLKTRLTAIKAKAAKTVQSQSELQVRLALANPGNAMHREFLKSVGVCGIVLPLAAIGWVSYQVFLGYYASNTGHGQYLGVDFAIHSSLLIFISWLIPWYILKTLKPSLEASALRGLTKGLAVAFASLENDVANILETLSAQHAEQRRQIGLIVKQCDEARPHRTESPRAGDALDRMLIS